MPLISLFESRWQEAETAAPAPAGLVVLRLSVLRDFAYFLHAEKSRALSNAAPTAVGELQSLENRLEVARAREVFQCHRLEEALNLAAQAPARKLPDLSEAILGTVDRSKLERFDRQWERAIAEAAAAANWEFWAVEAKIPIDAIEAAGLHLRQVLWPQGVPLYAESRGFSDGPSPGSPCWLGQWIWVGAASTVPSQSFRSLQGQYFSDLRWTQLFPGPAG